MNEDSHPSAGIARVGARIANVPAAHLTDVVRVVGLEPTLLSELDFESSASTNSTTPAQA